MRALLTHILIFLAFLLLTPLSMAQEDDIATIYLDDMRVFYKECQADTARYGQSDCRCLSLQFLDQIQRLGQYDRETVINGLEKNACPRTENTQAQDKMSDVPKEYLDEAQAFYDSCGTHITYSKHKNCECLAAEYLNARIKAGRFASVSSLKMDIAQKCFSAPAAAGFMYKRCSKSGYQVPTRFEIDEYCACVGNEYADMYGTMQYSFTPRLLIALETEANLRCRKKLK